jgi:hypothetical protein
VECVFAPAARSARVARRRRRIGKAPVRAALVCSAIVMTLSRPATAEPEQVLLVAPPAGLEQAVRAALGAWPIRVEAIGAAGAPGEHASSPGATMPGSGERARQLAADHDAGAVVWLSSDESGGHALWIYDARSGRAVARRLDRPPPFDEPTAAAVALSVKTLLRHSSVVPALERYGAPVVAAAPRFRVDSSAGLRVRGDRAGGVEPRLGVGARAAPGRLAELGALAAGLELGPGVSIDAPEFAGQFSDLTIGAALLGRIAPGRLSFWPRLGGSLHVTRIDGSIPGQVGRARARRINPALDAGIAIEVALRPWLHAAIGATASYALRRQTYLVGGQSVLSLPRVEGAVGVSLSVAIR